MKKIFFILITGLLVTIRCQQPKQISSEGFIPVKGGKVWYRIAGTGNKTPLLLLHGGPGIPSVYLKPLEVLGDDRLIIFYDQLGCGKSDHPADTTLWTTARFADELETVRKELGLKEIHLLGHSWGTMLATEYMTRKPEGIKSLILASPCITADRWLADANMLREKLPQAVRDTLQENERRGTITSASYVVATQEFYNRHVCRIPLTPELKEAFDNIGWGPYITMWGNNEFTCTGNLQGFDRSESLSDITIPTLFTCGEFDEATPATTKWYADQVKGSAFKMIAGGSHMTMNEKPGEYAAVLREFLKKND
jgi:proline iminopeptidase